MCRKSVLVALLTSLLFVQLKGSSSEKVRNTMVERLRADFIYRDALVRVGHNSTAVHKAGPETVFFAPSTRDVSSLSKAAFGHFNNSKSMERFFNGHTALVPDIKKIKNEQVIYNDLGHPLRLNVYTNPDDGYRTKTINGIAISDILDPTKDGSRIVVIPQMLIPATFPSIIQAVEDIPNLTAFRRALLDTGLGEELDAMISPITVFAPSNTALESLPSIVLDDPALLKETLWYNVIKGTRYSAGLFESDVISLKDGSQLVVIEGESSLILTDMTVVDVDIPLTNGVLHVIDGVFMLPDLPELYEAEN